MKVLSPFGPKIAKLKLSSNLIKKLNNEVEKIISKKNLVKKLDYSNKLVGQVKQEFQIPKSFIKKNLENIIFNEVKKYIYKCLGKKISKINIKNFWVVRQFHNDYNPIYLSYSSFPVQKYGYPIPLSLPNWPCASLRFPGIVSANSFCACTGSAPVLRQKGPHNREPTCRHTFCILCHGRP